MAIEKELLDLLKKKRKEKKKFTDMYPYRIFYLIEKKQQSFIILVKELLATIMY